jgi:hypothetical protein
MALPKAPLTTTSCTFLIIVGLLNEYGIYGKEWDRKSSLFNTAIGTGTCPPRLQNSANYGTCTVPVPYFNGMWKHYFCKKPKVFASNVSCFDGLCLPMGTVPVQCTVPTLCAYTN